jgi:hypothetical protein
VKKLFLCLVLAAFAAAYASAETGAVAAAAITLYTDFQGPVPQAVVDALRNEVDSAMSPMGLRFDWRQLSDFRSERVSAAVAVAHFEGRCDVTGLVRRQNQPGSLGWTEISDGTILPFTHVDCERIRTFVQSTLLGFRKQDQERAFGHALGRVLVHELFHVFGDTPKHGASGAAKENYSVDDLLAADFRFNEKQIRTLRSSKALAALKASNTPF